MRTTGVFGRSTITHAVLAAGLLACVGLGAGACGGSPSALAHHRTTARHGTVALPAALPSSTTTSSTTTTTVAPTTTTTTTTTVPPTTTAPPPPGGQHGPITSPPLPAPGPGFVANRVTAVGDSVMLDYEQDLQADIPGIEVTAAVSRQWTQGESVLAQLKSEGALGAVVIVGLGTNGPITQTEFDSMMRVLTGAARVVFVNVRVDRTWQDPNNAVIANGVAGRARVELANWNGLAEAHPTWLYPTQTHMPIGGTGAQNLAALVAQTA